MCGIAGLVALDGRVIAASDVKAMTDQMVQRGPDDDGFFAAEGVGIGMRRLSIIDVGGGHQPISNETEDLWLVLNGEIYNHVELREQLVARGHTFRTGSDAEVILHLYEDHGTEALAHLNGMFAFALYDTRRRAVWIARDRLGIKPLFLAQTPRELVFASDIRALRQRYPTDVDPEQVLKYLALSYAPQGETLWRGVTAVLPGHFVWIEQGVVTTRQYWSVTNVGTWQGSESEAAEALDDLLRDSVRLQLRSDVPLGVFSSGGVDSSTIVAIAAEQLSTPLRTFTIRFDGKVAADADFASAMARQYGTSHTEIVMGAAEAAMALDELLPLMDEPLADSALLPAYWLSKAARAQGIKVLLNGAGGDEIFGGYPRHWPSRRGSPTWVADRMPAPARHLISAILTPFQPSWAARVSDPRLAWATSVGGVSFAALRSLLRESGAYETVAEAARTEYAGLVDRVSGLGFAQTRMLVDVQTYLPGDVLALTDKATMAVSVEGRVPLLDHRLVEFAFSLPAHTNMRAGLPKGLLKRAMRTRLDSALLHRSKEGFNAPDAAWLSPGSPLDLSDELLGHRTPLLDQVIDPAALETLLASPDRRREAAATLFALFFVNRWCRAQEGPEVAARSTST